PPHVWHVAGTRRSIGATSPHPASRLDSSSSARTTSSSRSPRKASRMRSTTVPTLGKSIAISSAKHSCTIGSSHDRCRSRPCQGSRRRTQAERMRRTEETAEPAPALARADRQQNFLAKGVLELLELQRRLALVAEHLEHRRPALFGHLHSAAL